MSNALIESLKELARVIVLAIIPVMITGVEDGSFDWRVVGTVALLAALRFIDKLAHEIGKEDNISTLVKGITRF